MSKQSHPLPPAVAGLAAMAPLAAGIAVLSRAVHGPVNTACVLTYAVVALAATIHGIREARPGVCLAVFATGVAAFWVAVSLV